MSPPPSLQPTALPIQTRLAPLGEVSPDARTIDVVWTTGATVRRQRYVGWDTAVPFDEELIVTHEAIDLDRLRAGAPVLDSHNTSSTDAQRAVVDDAWLEAGQGLARLRFPRKGTDARSDRLFEMARQRVIRNISVGYSIDQVRVVAPVKAGDVERRIIERWTPYELSFVTVPADAGSQIRSGPMAPVTILGAASAPVDMSIEAVRARMHARMHAAGIPLPPSRPRSPTTVYSAPFLRR
jgi:hypothetical protein